MKSKQIFAYVLIGALFIWSFLLSDSEQTKLLEEKKAKATADSLAKVDSLAQLESLAKVNAKPASAIDDLAQMADAATDSMVAIDSLAPKAISPRTVVVQTETNSFVLSNVGASIQSITLNDLENANGEFPELLQDSSKSLLSFALDETDFSKEVFALDSTVPDTLKIVGETTIVFTWEKNGKKVERTFGFHTNKTDFSQKLTWSGFTVKKVKTTWESGMKETEEGGDQAFIGGNFFSEVIFRTEDEVFRETETEEIMHYPEEKGNKISWVGLRRKYAAGVFIFDEARNIDIEAKPMAGDTVNGSEQEGTYSLVLTDEVQGQEYKYTVGFFALHHEKIKEYNLDFDHILFSGYSFFFRADVWFPALCGFMLVALKFLAGIFSNYGVAIIVLTLMVKLATLPLTIKQTKSMRAMQAHKPALDKLRKKHKGDSAKYQQEMMAYYRKNGVNPLGGMLGCLPMVLQMPVFISLYVTFRYAVELRNAPFVGWITDLSSSDVVTDLVSIPIFMPNGITILPIFMAVTMFYQMKPTMTNPEMKGMLYIMPLMMFAFSGSMPSGLVLYWTISNIFGIFQYKIIGSPSAPGV